MGDEGVGVHAIRYLEKSSWPENIELIDAGVPGASLMYLLENRELSIIIDCGDFGAKPGEILVVDAEKLKKPGDEPISLHGTSLLGTLALAKSLDIKLSRVILICIQPKKIEMSEKLSEEVKEALPKVKDQVTNIAYQ
jgi:hydrogenase maturation protease